MIHLVLADDHPIVLNGLKQLFNEEEGFRVEATCSDGEEALETVRRVKPDILVLDMRMPRLNGIQVLRRMKELIDLPTRPVLLAATLDDDEVLEAMRLGVRGVVLKEMAPSMLVRCVRKVHEGGQWLEKDSVGRAIDRLLERAEVTQTLKDALTEREVEIATMVAAGQSNKDVADKLFISQGTVKAHLHTIYSKLGVNGRVGLMVWAREQKLI